MRRFLIGAGLVLLLAGGAARAGVAFDVAVGMNLDEDTRIFLNVTNQTWRPAVAGTVIQGCAHPEDDFPVIAFLSYYSHRSPSFILNLRREGYAWSDILFQVNVQPSVLFVGIDRDPGPPYGKAWGYWKKHYRPGTRMRYRISDRDIVGLVKVQTASRHLGANPRSVIEAQRGGRRPESYMGERWRKSNGRQSWAAGPARGNDRGNDRRGNDLDLEKTGHGGHGPDSKAKGQKGNGHGKGSGRD
jgi:hypothetical protein